jgi:hypothetical protein
MALKMPVKPAAVTREIRRPGFNRTETPRRAVELGFRNDDREKVGVTLARQLFKSIA